VNEMTLEVSENIAKRVKELAESQNRSVDELIAMWLAVSEPTPSLEEDEDLPPCGTAARALYEIERSNFHSGKTDTAERSREILRTEFVEYLKSR
jgi:hypothetical protein